MLVYIAFLEAKILVLCWEMYVLCIFIFIVLSLHNALSLTVKWNKVNLYAMPYCWLEKCYNILNVMRDNETTRLGPLPHVKRVQFSVTALPWWQGSWNMSWEHWAWCQSITGHRVHPFIGAIHLSACFWKVWGNQWTKRNLAQIQGKHRC